MSAGRAQHFCRECGDPILWARTVAGRMIPLDPGSDQARGTFVLRVVDLPDGSARRVAVGLSRADRQIADMEGELLFQAHQAVCRPRRVRGQPPPPAVLAEAHQVIEQAKKRWRSG